MAARESEASKTQAPQDGATATHAAVAYGIGAAGLVAAAVGGMLVYAKWQVLKDCPDLSCSLYSKYKDDTRVYDVGRIMIGVGGLIAITGAIVGTILLFNGRPPPPRQSAWLMPLSEATR